MTDQKFLVLDVSYMCHRIQHVAGHLEYDGSRTGVIFGFLRDLLLLRDYHNTENFVFCFDSRKSIRKKDAPHYKINRQKLYDAACQEDRDEAAVMQQQIRSLQD